MSPADDLPHFADSTAKQAAFDTAAVALLPVPYDQTSTWKKGAAAGPGAIIRASTALEDYDIETGTRVIERGIATVQPIEHDGSPEVLADLVEARWDELADAGKLPVVIGGEHSVSIGAIRAAARRHADLTVLQVDAHSDLRDSYHGSRFNHACVMARAQDVAHIVQVGIRSTCAEEQDRLARSNVWYDHQLKQMARQDWIGQVVAQCGEQVYLTIDMDGFDPALVPATGTPEPGGLDWYDVTGLIEAVAANSRIVGMDVVELCPAPGQWASEFLAAKLIYRTLSIIYADVE